ncbi:hypothetical protein [Methanococcoides alaskense]|uniref:Uncharacterized protein n=1 Tax=Methanococcoides alaskense TaxID=325778 RepID=A0AA90Z7J4_9EURY|nr:hypothetical protein [Methanococcoides alaskense]MDA0524049.1 hypothetical protein [Methanococcoides alaskense]MDR6222499.1 hypothetical protein [Methanococcoides alaskense]
MLNEDHTCESKNIQNGVEGGNGETIRKQMVDPYHIDEFNDIISKMASMGDRDVQISKGINKLTVKVCNTAVKLAKEADDIPLNLIDQAITLNFASSKEIEHDINRMISEKMNLGQMFHYPEKFRYDRNRKKDLVLRKVPENKKLGININYAIEAFFAQQASQDKWNLIINHEWFELSTRPRFELAPEMLSAGLEYGSNAGVVNINEFFDMDSLIQGWGGGLNLFDPVCFDLLMKHTVQKISSVDEKGIMHTYEIEWIDE